MVACFRKIFLSRMALITLVLISGSVKADKILNFGVYTSDKPSAVVKQFRPVLTELEKSLKQITGEDYLIRMQVASSYEKGVEDLVTGKVDFSRFGPASYIEAKAQNPGLKIIAAEAQNGEKVFYGIICVHQDSDIQSIADLKDRTFAFGDQQSTIGRYLSQLYLMDNGLHSRDLGHYEYLGRHDMVGAAVGAGKFDGGALKESTFTKLVNKGTPIRELARFENVTKPWIASAKMTQQDYQALQQALLTLDNQKALKALKKNGFVKAMDADYDRIRVSIEKNSGFFAD